MRRVVILIFLGSIVSILLIIQLQSNNKLKSWGVKIDLAGFEQKSFIQDKNKSSEVEEVELIKNDLIVRITKTIISDHKKYIDDKNFLLLSLYTPTTSPYPEALSNTIECPNEFKPQAETAKHYGQIYTLFAGERFNFGVCSQDLISYHSAYGIFDCKNKGVFEIRAFDKKDNLVPKSIVQSFSC